MIEKYVKTGFVLMVIFLFAACNDEKQEKSKDDTLQGGTIHISVDESFKPVIEEQIRVFESSFPNAHIIAEYKPEADCLKDFFRDTANRMVIVTRSLNANEDKYLIDSLNYIPGWSKIATDAITIIINSKSHDTLFSLDRLKEQLTGKINREQIIVFDGLNATSTVSYIRDSILHGEQFDTAVVKAAKSSSGVIDYVSTHENAIGLVGISWIGNPEDTAQVNMLKKVKIAYVRCDQCGDSPYVKPVQLSIVTKRYPLVRGLYYLIKENYQGLGTGFINFLKYERGQLIFRRAYLAPEMDFRIRNVKINEKL